MAHQSLFRAIFLRAASTIITMAAFHSFTEMRVLPAVSRHKVVTKPLQSR